MRWQASTCKGHACAQSPLRSMERYYAPNIKSHHELNCRILIRWSVPHERPHLDNPAFFRQQSLLHA